MKRTVLSILAIFVFSMLVCLGAASAAQTKVTFLGQSTFQITSGNINIIIDPGLVATQKPETVKDATIILITHDHFDHIGEVMSKEGVLTGEIPWVKNVRPGAIVVAAYETMPKLIKAGLAPDKALNGGFGRSIGGLAMVNGVQVAMTQAVHGSSSGPAVGYIVKIPKGPTIYHGGDTGLFSDMSLISDLYPIDIALLPTGGTFTMDYYQAAEAVAFLKPKVVVPMHYGSFPMLEKDPKKFTARVNFICPKVRVTALKPGESYTWGKKRAK